MPKSAVEDSTRDLLPEDTLFQVKLREVTEKTIEYVVKKEQQNGKKPGDRDSFTKWAWKFQIVDGEFTGQNIYADTDSRITNHPENQPRQFAEVLLGRSLDVGIELDTDDLIGLTAQAEVAHETYTKNGETKTVAKLSQLYPTHGVDPWAAAGSSEPPF